MSFNQFMRDGISVGSLFGTRIVLRPSFFMLLILAPLLNLSFATLGLVFSFVLMHEFAHIGMGKVFGLTTPRINVMCFGMSAEVGTTVGCWWRNMLVYIAGPASNFLLATMLVPLYNSSGVPIIREMIAINIALGIFNLLPLFPMDGSGIINCLLRGARVPNGSINTILFVISTLTAVFMLYIGARFGGMMIAGIAIFLWINAFNLYKNHRLFLRHLN